MIRFALAVQDEQADLRALMRRYRNRPMFLADHWLVRLSEIHLDGQTGSPTNQHYLAPTAETPVAPARLVRLMNALSKETKVAPGGLPVR